MLDSLPDWPRKHYCGPAGRPFIFYAVFGAFQTLPPLGGTRYRSTGVFPGLKLSHYSRKSHPDVLRGFQENYPWDDFIRRKPSLAARVSTADECLILKGELDDAEDLNYF